MKILLWNINHRSGKYILKITNELLNHNADIIVLTEFQDNKNGDEIRDILYNNGYIYEAYNKSLKDIKISQKKTVDINSVFICSKLPIKNFNAIPLQDNEERIIQVIINDIHLYAMYFPQNQAKKPLFNFMYDLMSKTTDTPILFLGDFNTGNNLLDKETSKASPFHCEKEFNDILNHGYIDVWRYFNGSSREYTWYSPKNGFRIDHCFIHKKHSKLLNRCYYVHEPRIEKISDHSMMIIELNIWLPLLSYCINAWVLSRLIDSLGLTFQLWYAATYHLFYNI